MNNSALLIVALVALASVAIISISTSEIQAKKGAADEHISDKGKERMSDKGREHSGVEEECIPPICPPGHDCGSPC